MEELHKKLRQVALNSKNLGADFAALPARMNLDYINQQ
jgi:hypothetical protein